MANINKKEFKNRLIRYFQNRFTVINQSPIFILGNQKSGTTAIAHLLSDFGGLSKTLDIPPLWQFDAYKIMFGQIDFENFLRYQKIYFSTEIIKEPNLTFFADRLLKTFPKAKYLFIVRDPRDNIRSHLNRLNIPGNFDRLPEHFLKTNMRKMLMSASTWGGCETENYVSALAYKWNKATDNYFLNRDRMILLKYEDFLVDKLGVIEKIAVQLSIPKRADIKDKIDIQYQPPGDHSVSLEEFFGTENLMQIEKICGFRMKEFNYNVGNIPGSK